MNFGKSVKPLIAVVFALCGVPSTTLGKVIFTEDFDSLDDWTSTMHTTETLQLASRGHNIPEGWSGVYQGTQWSPELGYPDSHASIEILASNADKARSKQKSAVMWRESYSKGWRNWASDSQLLKIFDEGHKTLYVEFYIRFSPNFYGKENVGGWTSKIFRAGSWSRENEANIFSGFAEETGPIAFWDYKHDNYGVRNVLAFRGGPWGENYKFNDEYDSSLSLNYGSHTSGMEEGGSDPSLIDKTGLIETALVGLGQSPSHKQVFGDSDQWTKVAFYLKMNSSAGARDGVFAQWLNGQRIQYRNDVPWVQENQENRMAEWNFVSIGGNDYFQPYPNDVRFEDWYAIDDLLVSTSIPDDLGADNIDAAPSPPADLRAQ